MKAILKKTSFALLICCSVQAQTISLDVGHTPEKSGAISPYGKTEYAYNLAMARTLFTKMSAWANVIPVPATTNLPERTKTPSHLFLSIHHDSYSSEVERKTTARERSGYSIFVSKKNPQFEKSLLCAQRIAAALNYVGEHRSQYHEKQLKGEGKTLLDPLGVYQYDNLIVLKSGKMPAVLVEIGVIQNPDEATRLEQPETIHRISQAINVGVKSCLNQ